MARPKRGSWDSSKKLGRFMVYRGRVVWKFRWQEQPRYGDTYGDSDWGGTKKDRRSTSGGVFMLGSHPIKTWSATQQAYALSSAEAELYAMVEGVARAKGLCSLARDLGYEVDQVIRLGTDSQAAKSFVNRRGLGRMRHLDIRDMWLQNEVLSGKVVIAKVSGIRKPADLMTKVLGIQEVVDRLAMMNMDMYDGEGNKYEASRSIDGLGGIGNGG